MKYNKFTKNEKKIEKPEGPLFSEISEDTDAFFKSIMKKINQPFVLKFKLINHSKLKTAVKVQKVADVYQYISNADVLVFFNEEIFDKLDNGAKEILLRQELDKITVNGDNGKIKLVKPDVVTFSGILKKYGFEKVARANQLNDLVVEGDKLSKETETFFEK